MRSDAARLHLRAVTHRRRRVDDHGGARGQPALHPGLRAVAAAQLDGQLRERRRNFTRRIEAIDRIQQATGGLSDRIDEISAQEKALNQLDDKLIELTSYMMDAKSVTRPKAEPARTPELSRA